MGSLVVVPDDGFLVVVLDARRWVPGGGARRWVPGVWCVCVVKMSQYTERVCRL